MVHNVALEPAGGWLALKYYETTMAEERTEAEQAADTAGSDSKRLVRERSCDVFSAPHSGNAGGGVPVGEASA